MNSSQEIDARVRDKFDDEGGESAKDRRQMQVETGMMAGNTHVLVVQASHVFRILAHGSLDAVYDAVVGMKELEDIAASIDKWADARA